MINLVNFWTQQNKHDNTVSTPQTVKPLSTLPAMDSVLFSGKNTPKLGRRLEIHFDPKVSAESKKLVLDAIKVFEESDYYKNNSRSLDKLEALPSNLRLIVGETPNPNKREKKVYGGNPIGLVIGTVDKNGDIDSILGDLVKLGREVGSPENKDWLDKTLYTGLKNLYQATFDSPSSAYKPISKKTAPDSIQFSGATKKEPVLKLGGKIKINIDKSMPQDIKDKVAEALKAFEGDTFFTKKQQGFNNLDLPSNMEIIIYENPAPTWAIKRSYGKTPIFIRLVLKNKDGTYTPLGSHTGSDTNTFAKKEVEGQYGLKSKIKFLFEYNFTGHYAEKWENFKP